jgi:hypothetical protein
MNLMTRVEGDPDQELFYETGCLGFPTLAVLDADGTLLAKHQGQRNVEGFDATIAKAREFQDVLKKAAGGDAAAKATVLEKRVEWGSIPLAEARKTLAEVGNLDADRKQKIEQGLLNIEFNEANREKDPAQKFAKLDAMRAGNRIPKDARGGTVRFWGQLVMAAEGTGDAARMKTALDQAKQELAGDANAQRFLETAEQRLEKLQGKKDG